MTASNPAATIDVRTIAPPQRHALIFGCFDSLKPGQWLELINDHDPQPLRHHFTERSPGQFEWKYLVSGPLLWHVQIRKADDAAAKAEDFCCSGGACCG